METRGEKNNLVDTALRQEGTHGARDTRAVRAALQPDAASQSGAAPQPNIALQLSFSREAASEVFLPRVFWMSCLSTALLTSLVCGGPPQVLSMR